MADDVEVRFGADISQLTASMSQVRYALQGLTEPLRGVRDNLGELAEAFIAAFAVERISQFVEKFAELGAQTQRTAALLGVGNEEVSGLDLLAKASAGSLEGLTMAFERMGLALARANSGSEQQMAALRALGLSAKDLEGIPLEDKLELLADKFSVLKDGTEKDAIAMALLGRSGAQMIPIFNQGAEGIRQYAEMAERAGSAMSHDQIEAAEKLHLGILELSASFTGAGNSIMTMFQPALSGLIRVTTDLAEAFTRSLNTGGAFGAVLNDVAVAAKLLVTALSVAVGAVQTLLTVVQGATEAMANNFRLLGRIIYDAFTLNYGDIKEAFADMLAANHGVAIRSANSMEQIFQNVTGELRSVWNSAAADHEKIEQDKTARLNIINRDAVSARMAEIDGEIKVLQQALEQKKLIFEGEAQRHELTQDQKFAALLRETENEYQAELALLHQKEQIGGLTVAQHQKVLNEIKQLEAKHDTDVTRLNEQSIAAQQKNWEGYLGSITGAFNSQLRGLLQGTTSWKQAMQGMLLDLTVKFIELVEKWAVEWVAGEIARTTATTVQSTARSATEQAAMAATLPARVGKFVSDMTADAALVFGGVFANLAPFLGPAAAGPAAASQGAVLAQLANVPKLDVGTNMVLSDGFAMIHANEQIIPARTSGPYQQPEAAGPSGGVTIQINAMDARSFVDQMKNSRSDLATIFRGLVRDGQIKFAPA